MCYISGKQATTTVLYTVLCVTLVASKQAITTVLCTVLHIVERIRDTCSKFNSDKQSATIDTEDQSEHA